MKIIVIALLLSLTLLTASSKNIDSLTDLNTAKVTQIKEFYKKYLQKKCGFTAANFTQMHTQKEWISMQENSMFIEEVSKICPKSQTIIIRILDKNGRQQFEDLYRFSVKYAKDTNIFPPC